MKSERIVKEIEGRIRLYSDYKTDDWQTEEQVKQWDIIISELKSIVSFINDNDEQKKKFKPIDGGKK